MTTSPPKNLLPALVLVLVSLACTLPASISPTPPGPVTPTPGPPAALPTPIPLAEITFRVTLPPETPPGEPIQLTLLDEVTGLALNPIRYTLQAENETTYAITTPIIDGTTLLYRYTRQGQLTAEEHTSDGRPVRYRMYVVDGPGAVTDTITRWNDTSFTGPTGRIDGQITDALTGIPIPNLLVTAGGAQTLTAWDGTYLLEGLPPGVHNLVAAARDGTYRAFQQGARVAAQATTPASFALTPAPLALVDFEVAVPPDTIPGVPVRLAGNLGQLGNTFADLPGGASVLAARLPTLQFQGEGRYRLTLALPVGAFVRYKYTLGDGFWNAEHDSQGRFRLREFTVPEGGLTLRDTVTTWQAGKNAPVWFEVNVPPDTPPEETIYIQFDPWGWNQPLPMWRLEPNKWVYLLSSPLDILGQVSYRYCRGGQCGAADDSTTAGPTAQGRPLVIGPAFQAVHDEVTRWQWLDPFPGTIPAPSANPAPRAPGFLTGIELQASSHPSWTPQMAAALQGLRALGASWAVLTPTWTFTRPVPPVFEGVTGVDAPWADLLADLQAGHAEGLKMALYPAARFTLGGLPTSAEQWWTGAPRDFSWWNVWFERYITFALHHAGLAARSGAEALVLGGDWLAPALPDGLLADGSSSGVPADAEARWRALIAAVRAAYGGQVFWALPYPQGVRNPPPFLDAVDGVYLLFSPPLAEGEGASPLEMQARAEHVLDTEVWPFAFRLDKPVVVALAYPSAAGGATGCLPGSQGGCLALSALSQPNPDLPNIALDLQNQLDAYRAILEAVAARDWVGGVVSRGYYPPVALRDKSISVHGKPAGDLLRAWFAAWGGQIEP